MDWEKVLCLEELLGNLDDKDLMSVRLTSSATSNASAHLRKMSLVTNNDMTKWLGTCKRLLKKRKKPSYASLSLGGRKRSTKPWVANRTRLVETILDMLESGEVNVGRIYLNLTMKGVPDLFYDIMAPKVWGLVMGDGAPYIPKLRSFSSLRSIDIEFPSSSKLGRTERLVGVLESLPQAIEEIALTGGLIDVRDAMLDLSRFSSVRSVSIMDLTVSENFNVVFGKENGLLVAFALKTDDLTSTPNSVSLTLPEGLSGLRVHLEAVSQRVFLRDGCTSIGTLFARCMGLFPGEVGGKIEFGESAEVVDWSNSRLCYTTRASFVRCRRLRVLRLDRRAMFDTIGVYGSMEETNLPLDVFDMFLGNRMREVSLVRSSKVSEVISRDLIRLCLDGLNDLQGTLDLSAATNLELLTVGKKGCDLYHVKRDLMCPPSLRCASLEGVCSASVSFSGVRNVELFLLYCKIGTLRVEGSAAVIISQSFAKVEGSESVDVTRGIKSFSEARKKRFDRDVL